MPEVLTAERFASHLHETFLIRLDASMVETVLTRVDRLPVRPGAPTARAPFALVFRGPREPALPQRIHRREHPILGALDVFLVPVGPDGIGPCYEAVFN